MWVPQRVWDGAFGRQGLSLENAMMRANFSDGAKELRDECWLPPRSSTLGCRRKQRQWLARVILYEVFSPKSFTTFVPVPSFLLHFWRPTLAHLFWHSRVVVTIFYVNHYPHKWDIARQHTYPPFLRSCKFNTFVLFLVNQQSRFAWPRGVLWSLSPVPDRPYLVPFRFCNRYSSKFDLLLPCDTFSFSLLSLDHIHL